jgi:hypothetical protein
MRMSHLIKYIIVYEVILIIAFAGVALFFAEEQKPTYNNVEETEYAQLSLNVDEGRCIDELYFNLTDYGQEAKTYIIFFPGKENEYRKELIPGQNVTINDAPFLPINESTEIPYQMLVMTNGDIDGGTYIGGNMTIRGRDENDNL